MSHLCHQNDCMERLVLAPLLALQGMFTAPQKLIQKRYDKLLDYCSRLERSSSASSSSLVPEEPPGPARRDYEALNAMLVEELQRFNTAAYAIRTNCVICLVDLLRGLMERVLLRFPSIQQLPVRSQVPGVNAPCSRLQSEGVAFAFPGSAVKHG